EFHNLLGGNLDCFAGRRIAADPRLSISPHQAPNARQDEYAILLGLANSQFGETFEILLGDPIVHAGRFRQFPDNRSLSQSFDFSHLNLLWSWFDFRRGFRISPVPCSGEFSLKQNDAEMFRTLPVNPMIRDGLAVVKKKTSKNRPFPLFFCESCVLKP